MRAFLLCFQNIKQNIPLFRSRQRMLRVASIVADTSKKLHADLNPFLERYLTTSKLLLSSENCSLENCLLANCQFHINRLSHGYQRQAKRMVPGDFLRNSHVEPRYVELDKYRYPRVDERLYPQRICFGTEAPNIGFYAANIDMFFQTLIT